ncbi:tryptophan-rich sensory protein [bacterium]|nr:tryptophan-rich sensory protein [bacterium]
MKKNLKLILFLLVSFLAGAFGGIFTQTSVSDWYVTLSKPSFNPPSWLFSPVWTLLYILIAIAFFIAFIFLKNKKDKEKVIILFSAQWILNVLWSFLFFYLNNPMWAFIEIIVLWVVILISIIYFFKKKNKKSAYLLIPYILWVSFAGLLNYFIYILN